MERRLRILCRKASGFESPSGHHADCGGAWKWGKSREDRGLVEGPSSARESKTTRRVHCRRCLMRRFSIPLDRLGEARVRDLPVVATRHVFRMPHPCRRDVRWIISRQRRCPDCTQILEHLRPRGQRSLRRYSSDGFDEEFVAPSARTAFHCQSVFARMVFQ